jgi:hypothetical protein
MGSFFSKAGLVLGFSSYIFTRYGYFGFACHPYVPDKGAYTHTYRVEQGWFWRTVTHVAYYKDHPEFTQKTRYIRPVYIDMSRE